MKDKVSLSQIALDINENKSKEFSSKEAIIANMQGLVNEYNIFDKAGIRRKLEINKQYMDLKEKLQAMLD